MTKVVHPKIIGHMGRVIQTNSSTTIRNRYRRTIAELLCHLVQKASIDEEGKEAQDMVATIVFSLMEIDATIKQAVAAWEKRDYWIKAERFQNDWQWVVNSAANLDDVLRHEAWDLIPDLLFDLLPYFADIQINKMTRKADVWNGRYAQLLAQPPLDYTP